MSPSRGSRERLVITAGFTVAGVALFFAMAAVPFYKSWMAREARISAAEERLSRMRSQISAEQGLSRTLSGLERMSGERRQVLTARTQALAASELQRVMRTFAERSQVTIDRLEFSSSDAPMESAAMIPVTIAAVGDIYGIADFLALLRAESPVVEIKDISLVSNSALRSGLIQLSMSAQAPVVIQ